MEKFTVISNHDCQVVCDLVYAVSGDAALVTVAAARPDAEIIVAIPGDQNELCFAGEGMVDGTQLIENAGGNDGQMDVLRSVLTQEGFEIQTEDNEVYFWKGLAGVKADGPRCDTEAEAIANCFIMNADLQLRSNEDGSLGQKPSDDQATVEDTITTNKGYTLKSLNEGSYYQCTHLNGVELTADHQDVLVLKTDGSFLCGAAYTPANWAGVKV